MSDTAMQLRNIARVLRKGFAGQLAFDSAECQGMAKSLATAANELERAERIAAALRADRESLSSQLQNCTYDRDGWKRRAERFERILAELRDTPCVATRCSAAVAVTAAEQEVGRE